MLRQWLPTTAQKEPDGLGTPSADRNENLTEVVREDPPREITPGAGHEKVGFPSSPFVLPPPLDCLHQSVMVEAPPVSLPPQRLRLAPQLTRSKNDIGALGKSVL